MAWPPPSPAVIFARAEFAITARVPFLFAGLTLDCATKPRPYRDMRRLRELVT
jgi:hypothetical protein